MCVYPCVSLKTWRREVRGRGDPRGRSYPYSGHALQGELGVGGRVSVCACACVCVCVCVCVGGGGSGVRDEVAENRINTEEKERNERQETASDFFQQIVLLQTPSG